MTALGWIILVIVAAAALIALGAWFYQRATGEVSLVRTGIGGRKVVIDGGVLALPYFHEVSRVNMANDEQAAHEPRALGAVPRGVIKT